MASHIATFIVASFFLTASAVSGVAGALARLGEDGATIEDNAGRVELSISLSQSVPWRIFTLGQPARLIIEFSELQWDREPEANSASITAVRVGTFTPGTSRLVAVLREPLVVEEAEMIVADDSTADLKITLGPTTAEDFRAGVEVSDIDLPRRPESKAQLSDGRVVVALDPGHGGIDPGAESGDLAEADLMLSFARRLKEELVRRGRFDVVLTRTEDSFVPLETRMTLARSAGADVFLSLHADALAEDAGSAEGMTLYTLADGAVDAASQQLAERHARDDILAGVDLAGIEDELAILLMDLARRETLPKSRSLADIIIEEARSSELALNSRPDRTGNFSVLKAADMPSLLIELGFLSSSKDRDRLTSDDWNAKAANVLARSLALWVDLQVVSSHGVTK